jgi:hypothetical protein
VAAVASAWLQLVLTVTAGMHRPWPTPPVAPAAAEALAVSSLTVLLAGSRWRLAAAPATLTVGVLIAGWAAAAAAVLALAAAYGVAARHPARRLQVGRTRWGMPVGVGDQDRLLHCHVLGPTGSGKSTTVLFPWMRQDLEHGLGFTLIEPKGDLADAVRRYALPHPGTLIRLDPTRPACPHINPLAGSEADAGEGLALALDQVDPAGHPFYRTVGRVLLVATTRAVVAALGSAAGLSDVLAAIRDPGRRRALVTAANLPDVAAYFEQDFGRLQPARQQELALGLVHRLEALTAHPGLAAMWRPPYDVTLDEVVGEEPTRLLASFPIAQLGLGAKAAGTLLWHLLIQAVYRLGPADRLRHVLYLDEFHQYVAPDLADVLAMVRGYGVAVVLAHQDLGQLSPALKAAVAANARSRLILGGTGPGDQGAFRDDAAPYAFPPLRYRPRGEALWLGIEHGVPTPPRLVRLPRPAP